MLAASRPHRTSMRPTLDVQHSACPRDAGLTAAPALCSGGHRDARTVCVIIQGGGLGAAGAPEAADEGHQREAARGGQVHGGRQHHRHGAQERQLVEGVCTGTQKTILPIRLQSHRQKWEPASARRSHLVVIVKLRKREHASHYRARLLQITALAAG